MVSNSLDIPLEEFLKTLERLQHDFATDPDYQSLRADLPADWPL